MTESTITGSDELERAAASLSTETICVAVKIGTFGNTRRMPSSAVEVDADRELIKVSKQLLDSDELKAIHRLDGEVRNWLYNVSVPSLFRPGVYRVKVEAVEQIDRKLAEFREGRAVRVEALAAAYDQRVAEARGRLRAAWSADDYPPVGDVVRAFAFDWEYIEVGDAPGRLEKISSAIFQSQREKAESRWREAATEYRELLRVAMADLVNHMVERLSPGSDGRRKVFRNSLVGNLSEFLETFSLRDVTDDAELQRLVGQARELLSGIDADTLRKSDGLRESVRRGFERVKGELDTMLVVRPKRRISFEEE